MRLSISEPLKKSYWEDRYGEVNFLPSLSGSKKADVVIIGGGFVGLWTALTIKEYEPDCEVVVLERDGCGRGASGRNGGLVMSWWPKILSLMSFCSPNEALFLANSTEKAIKELKQFCYENNIEANYHQGGWLWTATNKAHIGAWNSAIEMCNKLGVSPFKQVSSKELPQRTNSDKHLAAVFEESNATVQPFALIQGMRRVALEKGVQIYEQSPVRRIQSGSFNVLITEGGKVRAEKVVIATNAWAASIPELRKKIVPVNSSIVVTKPLEKERIWSNKESITDSQLLVNYYRIVEQNCILFGKGTGAFSYRSEINNLFSYDKEGIELTVSDLKNIYPQIQQNDIHYAWSGPIDRTFDSLPVFGRLKTGKNIFYGIGWSGNGVGPSRIGGRILASLALEINNEWSSSSLVERSTRGFPPEPLRFIGGRAVRSAVLRMERAELQGARPKWWDIWLSRLAPAGLEDK